MKCKSSCYWKSAIIQCRGAVCCKFIVNLWPNVSLQQTVNSDWYVSSVLNLLIVKNIWCLQQDDARAYCWQTNVKCLKQKNEQGLWPHISPDLGYSDSICAGSWREKSTRITLVPLKCTRNKIFSCFSCKDKLLSVTILLSIF